MDYEAPDFTKMTIPKIKDWAKDNRYKIPSGLKKADMIEYLNGKISERGSSKMTCPIINYTDMNPRTMPGLGDGQEVYWRDHIINEGWAVVPIPGMTQAKVDEYVSKFYDWMEEASKLNATKDEPTLAFDRNNPSSWSSIPPNVHGIFKQHFGHQPWQWEIREMCLPIFQELYFGPNKDKWEPILTSFDGGCFRYSGDEPSVKPGTTKLWIHNDQPRCLDGFVCAQGVVNLLDNGPLDGGLVLIEDSKDIWSDYNARHPSDGIVFGYSDMSDEDLAGSRFLKICAPPGHIIIYDSRMFHCNIPPLMESADQSPAHGIESQVKEELQNNSILSSSSESIRVSQGSPQVARPPRWVERRRLVTYVSMEPKRCCTDEKILAKRQKLFQERRMTSHWTSGPWFKETQAESYDRTSKSTYIYPPEPELELNDIQKGLVPIE